METALPVPQCWAVIGSEVGCHQINYELPQLLPAPGPPLFLPCSVGSGESCNWIAREAGWMLCVMLQTFHRDGALAAVLNIAEGRGQLAGFAGKEWEEGKQGWLPLCALTAARVCVSTCVHVCSCVGTAPAHLSAEAQGTFPARHNLQQLPRSRGKGRRCCALKCRREESTRQQGQLRDQSQG